MSEALEALLASGVTSPENVGDVSGDINADKDNKFVIPLVVPVNVPSGDGRSFKENSLSIADFPLPLLWQPETSSKGHDGSFIVGKIVSAEITDKGIENAIGVFDSGQIGQEAKRMVSEGFLTKVSGDFDSFSATISSDDEQENFSGKISAKKVEIESARLIGATLVAKPAFQETSIILSIDDTENETTEIISEGEQLSKEDEFVVHSSEEAVNPKTVTASSGIPVVPPRDWFQNPELSEPTALTVLDSGQVFGHLALWDTSHIGMAGKVRPPRSRTNYSVFRSGVVRTDDGTDVTVGQLTLTHGHASLELSANEAKKHYDDTNSAVVDVVAGEDEFGIWFAGALRPDVTEYQIRSLRASSVSGDWRPVNGRLELVGACCVNVAGFPVTRAMVASAGSTVEALVAAGSYSLAHKRFLEQASLEDRLEKLEKEFALLSYKEDIEALKSALSY